VSSAGVIHIKFTLTDQFNKQESTHHTASRSDYISKTNIHHNIPLHVFDTTFALDILKERKNGKDKKKGDLEVLIKECPC